MPFVDAQQERSLDLETRWEILNKPDSLDKELHSQEASQTEVSKTNTKVHKAAFRV